MKLLVTMLLYLVSVIWLPQFARGQVITGFTLIDAESNKEIKSINSGDTIDIYGRSSLSIRVEVDDPSKVGSIRVTLNGRVKNTDNSAPFSLSGDDNGNYYAEPDLGYLGGHSVTATSFQEPSGNGPRISQRSIPFVIINSDPSPPTGAPVVTTSPPTSNPTAQTSVPTVSPTLRRTSAPTSPVTLYPTAEYQSAPTDVKGYPSSPDGTLSGILQPFQKLTLCFDGPETHERANMNPFISYRMDCTFSSDSAFSEFKVPGYFAADGNAANTRVEFGNVWCCHATVDLDGPWLWSVKFVRGRRAALYDGVRVVSGEYFDGFRGQFNVVSPSTLASRNSGRGHHKGRLSYVGEHHLLYSSSGGEYALQVGTDSPADFLAYAGFDNTPRPNHEWIAHIGDFNEGTDPTWAGGQGKGIIGALNYLADMGLTSFACETMNLEQGIKRNVFPYIGRNRGGGLRLDVSKLAQWQVVLDHASHLGLTAHIKLQADHQILDDGYLLDERRLYYREIQARFGHILSLTYNLGENITNTGSQRESYADYITSLDPYNHPIALHANGENQKRVFSSALGVDSITGVSVETVSSDVFNNTLKWVQESMDPKWIVTVDKTSRAEPSDAFDSSHNQARIDVLWGNIMAGGAGVSFHWNGDVTLPNFRERENLWKQASLARGFFVRNDVPFANMKAMVEGCSAGNRCLGNRDVVVVQAIQWENGVAVTLESGDASANHYSLQWYNPRRGGPLQYGSKQWLSDGAFQSLGKPPVDDGKDWIALIQRRNGKIPVTAAPIAPTTTTPTSQPLLRPTFVPTSSPSSQRPSDFPSSSPFADISSTDFPTRRPRKTPSPTSDKESPGGIFSDPTDPLVPFSSTSTIHQPLLVVISVSFAIFFITVN